MSVRDPEVVEIVSRLDFETFLRKARSVTHIEARQAWLWELEAIIPISAGPAVFTHSRATLTATAKRI